MGLPAGKIMIKAEFARLMKVTPETVSRWITRGKISKDSVTPEGKVIVMAAKRDLELNLSKQHVLAAAVARGTKKGGLRKSLIRTTVIENTPIPDGLEDTMAQAGISTNITLNECQRLWTLYRASLSKLELDEKEGRLVDAKEVESAAYDAARLLRDAILNVPDRISSILFVSKTEDGVRKILDDELRSALASCAGGG